MHSGRVKITVPDVDLGIWKVVCKSHGMSSTLAFDLLSKVYGDGSQSEPFIIGGPL